MWDIFQAKIVTPLKPLYISEIFINYTKHMLLKFKANGYQRVEIRNGYEPLKIYDDEGNFIKSTSAE